MAVILALVAIVIVSAAICHWVAKRKNLNTQRWIVAGALFGPFATPFVLLVKPCTSV